MDCVFERRVCSYGDSALSAAVRALGFGAVLWDQIPTVSGPPRPAIGGAVFNVMAHLARLGEQAALVSAVGDDTPGDDALAEVAANGVAGHWIGRVQAATCEVAVSIDAAGEPTYHIPGPTSWDEIQLNDVKMAGLRKWRPDCLFYGTIEQRAATSRVALQRILADLPTARLFVDLNLRHPHSTSDAIEFSLRHCSDLKLNEEEAKHAAGVIGMRWSGPENFCAATVARYGIERVIVTAGPAGCHYLDQFGYGRARAYRAPDAVGVADGVGAGDAFLAGLAHRLWAGEPLKAACDFANRLGAVVASRSGAFPSYSLADIAGVSRI